MHDQSFSRDQSSSREPTDAAFTGPHRPDAATRRRDLAWWAALNGFLLVAYGLVQNPYWARGGDSEVYLSMARSLVLGEGYRFNGQPAYLVQPVWPLMLAAVLKVSPLLLPVKLLTMLCLWAWLSVSYWVVRRWAGPRTSAMSIGLIAVSVPVVPLSYLPFSDPVFLLLTSASLLLALQIVEGRRFAWRVVALGALVVLAGLTRSASITTWPLVVAVLMSGRVRPRWGRRALAVAVTAVAFVGTFVGWRLFASASADALDPRYDAALTGHYGLINAPAFDTLEELLDAYEQRFVRIGRFAAALYLDPLTRSGAGKYLLNPLGWLGLGVVGAFAWRRARRRDWVWPVAVLFVVAISLNWPNPPTRYLLPVAPLLTVGAVLGGRQLVASLRPRWARRTAVGVAAAAVVGVVGYNALMYGHEVVVARSSDFSERYQGGAYASMPAVAGWLVRHTPADQEIGVTQAAPSRRLFTHGNMRAFHFLTNRPIMMAAGRHSEELTPALGRWAERHRVGHYLYQQPFATPSALGDLLGRDGGAATPWEVHELRDGRLHRVRDVPVDVRPVTRVPGL